MIKYFFESIFEKLKISLLVALIVFLMTMGNANTNNLNYFIFSIVIIFGYLVLENIYFIIKTFAFQPVKIFFSLQLYPYMIK